MDKELEKEIKMLESEILLIQDNIQRLRTYSKEQSELKWKNSHSLVFGELKHRCTSIKFRLTRIKKFSTYHL
jgi:hypothetical protein